MRFVSTPLSPCKTFPVYWLSFIVLLVGQFHFVSAILDFLSDWWLSWKTGGEETYQVASKQKILHYNYTVLDKISAKYIYERLIHLNLGFEIVFRNKWGMRFKCTPTRVGKAFHLFAFKVRNVLEQYTLKYFGCTDVPCNRR